MKIGVLTSSRADFGIYQSLLKKIAEDKFFELTIIAFGMHSSPYHGNTINEIKDSGYSKIHLINSLLATDDVTSISSSYGLTVIKFSDYWTNHNYDLVFCLGDRFEMSAAVQAGIPFGLRFAHIHGGETTTGAIDNIYRHQITLASDLHFVSTQEYAERVHQITGSGINIYTIGSLSLEELDDIELVNETILRGKFDIPNGDFILTTFQPDTNDFKRNEEYAELVKITIESLINSINFVISMPNADTNGSIFRRVINELKREYPNRISVVENFGKKNYFSAMKYARLMLGNSSSGIIEAASFNKYVVNVGDRQKGRSRSNNIIDCEFNLDQILAAIKLGLGKGFYDGENIYFKLDSSNEIIKILKHQNETL
jgi:GDP/UDP-N,N'-diacetylbacillosamine 2-epimerase (hydrolysing)